MIVQLDKNGEKLLITLFQTSALADTLDEIKLDNDFVNKFKQETNRYYKFLEKKVLKLLDDQHEISPEQFEQLDRGITHYSKEFAQKSFEDLFEIKTD